MHPIIFRYETASAKLVVLDDDLYELRNVLSAIPQQGHARGLMEQICASSDKYEWTLKLVVQAYSSPRIHVFLENAQLEEFYAKFGFVRDTPHKRPVRMTRLPLA